MRGCTTARCRSSRWPWKGSGRQHRGSERRRTQRRRGRAGRRRPSPSPSECQVSHVLGMNCIGPRAWSQSGSPCHRVDSGVAGIAANETPSSAGPRIGLEACPSTPSGAPAERGVLRLDPADAGQRGPAKVAATRGHQLGARVGPQRDLRDPGALGHPAQPRRVDDGHAGGHTDRGDRGLHDRRGHGGQRVRDGQGAGSGLSTGGPSYSDCWMANAPALRVDQGHDERDDGAQRSPRHERCRTRQPTTERMLGAKYFLSRRESLALRWLSSK